MIPEGWRAVEPVAVIRGEGPVVLGQPHGATWLPDDIAAGLNARGRALADTDWHIGRLYDGLLPGATVVRAGFHRYVIDANRPPGGESLYPGQATTGLIPETDFDGEPIWASGAAPGPAEVAARIAAFHAPYHAALAAELARVRARHGFALLWDCHSIRSRVPRLFAGELPVLNLGTNGGASCLPAAEAAASAVAAASPYPAVLNGRFRGGWTTRHHGKPAEAIHAIQMEIAQRAYLAAEAPPWAFDAQKAAALRPVLAAMIAAALAALAAHRETAHG